ncbi:MAG: molybdate ABC transporter substrate-binding protein [Solirubrobacteraceae bacterium]
MRRVALVALVALAGCGGGKGDHGAVTVAAASSLTGALTECGGSAKLEFGGSDDLAAQIRQGVGIDVFAAANMALPQQLAEDGDVQAPVAFATNRLVLAVPRDSSIASIDQLASAALVVGSASVPVGAYTRQVLARLPAARRHAIEGAIRSEEPDVKSIVGKLVTGAADAGFVYASDVMATDELRAVALPDGLQPTVVYGISIVRDSEAAKAFVDSVLHGACASALRKAGFGAPPVG